MLRAIRADRQIANKRGIVPTVRGTESRLPDYRTMGRFLGKVGIEAMAQSVLNVPNWNDELVENAGLDKLRRYVRYNVGRDAWPFAFRTLYPVNAVFSEDGVVFEVPHEFRLLVTDTFEFYIVLALFGVEFVMNLGGPTLDGWMRWLSENRGNSPLYPPKGQDHLPGQA